MGRRMMLTTVLLLAGVVTCPAVSGAREMAAALDTVNNRLLVVHDWKPASQYGDVRGELVTPGAAAAPLALVIAGAANTQSSPSVAFDSVLGRYLAVWQDDRTNLYQYEIWGQFIAADGALLGGNFRIVACPDASLREPVVGFEPSAGTYLLAWTDDRNYATTDDDVRGAVLNAGGAVLGAEFWIAGEAGFQRAPALARDSVRGRFLAVWEDYAAVTGPDVRGRLYSAAGAAAGSSFPIADSAMMQFGPSLAHDAENDRYLVTWSESDTVYSTEDDVHARLVSGEGALLGSEIVVSNAAGEQVRPSAAFDESGDRWLAAWADDRSINGPDVWGRYLDAAGTPTGTEVLLAGSPLVDEHAPAVYYDAACAYLGVAYVVPDSEAQEPGLVVVGEPCSWPEMTVTTPNGGEVIPSGSSAEVTWEPPPGTVSALVEYSLDGGVTWKEAVGAGGAASFTWDVPVPRRNVAAARIRVTALDATGAVVGSDESDADFTVEVVKLTSPAADTVYTSGLRLRIAWTTNATRREVATTTLQWSGNGGTTWLPVATLGGNPGFFRWRPPALSRTRRRCIVRVVLRGAGGRRLGKDESDYYFTLRP